MPDLLLENKYKNHVIAGIDEVGRGSWAGPLVAGAVILKQGTPIEGINDSKKLTPKKREILSKSILKHHISSIGSVSAHEINNIGLSKAIYLAITRAIESISIKPTLLLIDGNYTYDFGIKTINIPKGDSKSISIAAASIVAKVYRDNFMKNLALKHPEYAWHKNVGYGTLLHMEGLKTSGISKYHRVNYKPIQQILIDNQS
ncbi:MAG: ribonuclease HII [Alphaproteobacteria bacterium]|nr:ribonuclease HII [Alphaproteobacteria bacterium]